MLLVSPQTLTSVQLNNMLATRHATTLKAATVAHVGMASGWKKTTGRVQTLMNASRILPVRKPLSVTIPMEAMAVTALRDSITKVLTAWTLMNVYY